VRREMGTRLRALVPRAWLRGASLAVPDGWYCLVRDLLLCARRRARISPAAFREFRIVEAKSKFAMLVLHTTSGDAEFSAAVASAVRRSRRTCQGCGRRATPTTMHGKPWKPTTDEPPTQVLCARCRQRREAEMNAIRPAGRRRALARDRRRPAAEKVVNQHFALGVEPSRFAFDLPGRSYLVAALCECGEALEPRPGRRRAGLSPFYCGRCRMNVRMEVSWDFFDTDEEYAKGQEWLRRMRAGIEPYYRLQDDGSLVRIEPTASKPKPGSL